MRYSGLTFAVFASFASPALAGTAPEGWCKISRAFAEAEQVALDRFAKPLQGDPYVHNLRVDLDGDPNGTLTVNFLFPDQEGNGAAFTQREIAIQRTKGSGVLLGEDCLIPVRVLINNKDLDESMAIITMHPTQIIPGYVNWQWSERPKGYFSGFSLDSIAALGALSPSSGTSTYTANDGQAGNTSDASSPDGPGPGNVGPVALPDASASVAVQGSSVHSRDSETWAEMGKRIFLDMGIEQRGNAWINISTYLLMNSMKPHGWGNLWSALSAKQSSEEGKKNIALVCFVADNNPNFQPLPHAECNGQAR